MSREEFNKEMSSYVKAKCPPNKPSLVEKLKSRVGSIKNIKLDNLKEFSSAVSRKADDIKKSLPSVSDVAAKLKSIKIPKLTFFNRGPAKAEKQDVPSQNASSYISSANKKSPAKARAFFKPQTWLSNRLKPNYEPSLSNQDSAQKQELSAHAQVLERSMAVEKERALNKNKEELENLRLEKEKLEKEIAVSQDEQRKEKERISRIRQEKEKEDAKKKLELEQKLEEKEEKALRVLETESQENLRKKEQIEQELKDLLEKKKIERAKLEEIKQFRKQEEKNIGIKRFFMPAVAKQNEKKSQEEEKKREEALKKQMEQKIREEIEQKYELERKKQEELKKHAEAENRRKEEELKKQKELEKKRAEEKKKEGFKLGFIRIKTVEQLEIERKEEERKNKMREAKKKEEMQNITEELAKSYLDREKKEEFFSNVDPKEALNIANDPAKNQQKTEIFSNLEEPETVASALNSNEQGYTIQKLEKANKKDNYTIRVVKKEGSSVDTITIVDSLKK